MVTPPTTYMSVYYVCGGRLYRCTEFCNNYYRHLTDIFVTWGQLRVTSEFTRYCSPPVITMSKWGTLELNFVTPNSKKSRDDGFMESWLRSGTEISPGCGRGRGSPSLVTGGLKFFF